ncbi:MAG: choice-of-anchor D domain-containing protein [Pseudomonadota bacterium]|nr:choice-of-anchor D domain-containing protein [Pseudomonadota bacterium]
MTKAQNLDRTVKRERRVSVDSRYLDPQSANTAKEVGIELFDGEVITVELQRIEQRGPRNYTWHGRVEGYDNSSAILSVVDGQIDGTIVVLDSGLRSGRMFQIRSGPDGTQSLRQVNQDAFPPDHPPGGEAARIAPRQIKGQTETGSSLAPDAQKSLAQADSAAFVDVMVVYSNQTAAAAGTAIGAQIQQAVDTANTAYANSGVTTRLRLVHYEQANYDESGDFNTDLNRLTSGSDGYMDNVATLRNTYGADLVSLFVENSQYCGLAWVGPNASYAFSVINRGCASGNYSFAHELGHNFGALHDPYVDPSTSPYAYGHGLVDPAGGWRTVMAYNNACAAAGTSCIRIPYFSNASMTYGSPADPLGTSSTSDVARVVNQNAYTVANFRASVVGGGCSYALSPSSASTGANAVSASVAVSSGTGCAWNTASNAAWLSVGAGSGASGSANLDYVVAANAGPVRTGTISVGGQAFTVTQASGCTYAISPTSATVAASGGTATLSVTSGAACTWNASSSASWLTLSNAGGSGSASMTYTAAANSGSMRNANMTVNGATFIVTQAAAAIAPPPPPPAGVASLSSTSMSFGMVRVGRSSGAKSVTLTNSAGGPLTISALTARGANPGDFVRSGSCAVGSSLAAGQSCTLAYVFRPLAAGARAATLVVTTDSGTISLNLSGRGR